MDGGKDGSVDGIAVYIVRLVPEANISYLVLLYVIQDNIQKERKQNYHLFSAFVYSLLVECKVRSGSKQ